jgi:hypothetical protein
MSRSEDKIREGKFLKQKSGLTGQDRIGSTSFTNFHQPQLGHRQEIQDEENFSFSLFRIFFRFLFTLSISKSSFSLSWIDVPNVYFKSISKPFFSLSIFLWSLNFHTFPQKDYMSF